MTLVGPAPRVAGVVRQRVNGRRDGPDPERLIERIREDTIGDDAVLDGPFGPRRVVRRVVRRVGDRACCSISRCSRTGV